jgi:parallel beta-helix repeat protein
MNTMSRVAWASAALAAAVVCTPALGAEGRMPLWQPTTIVPGAEGQYVVTRNVTAVPGLPVIDVQPGTVAVEIDLNGFTLYGGTTDVIRATGVDSLVVRNGTIFGGAGHGIVAADCRKVVIEEVKIEFVQGFGIFLPGTLNFSLRRNVVVSDSAAPQPMPGGIFVDGFLAARPVEGVIEDNQLQQTGFGLTLHNGAAVQLLRNRIENPFAGDGIRVAVCDGCLVAENTIERAAGSGIVLETVNVNKVYNNVVFGSGGEGIALLAGSSDCFVLHNDSSRNLRSGLVVDGMGNHIDTNVLNSNQNYGLWILQGAGDNTYGRNVALRNLGLVPAPCMATPPLCAMPDLCDDAPIGANRTMGDNLGPGKC